MLKLVMFESAISFVRSHRKACLYSRIMQTNRKTRVSLLQLITNNFGAFCSADTSENGPSYVVFSFMCLRLCSYGPILPHGDFPLDIVITVYSRC